MTRGDTTRDIPWTDNFNQSLGIKGIPDLGSLNQRGMARFQPTGYAQVGAATFWPNYNNLNLFQITDNFLKMRGKHTMKLGFDFRRENLGRIAARFARGYYAFDGSFTQDPNNRGNTGDAMADFLLGKLTTMSHGSQVAWGTHENYFALYLADVWKLTPRLTMNYGARWEPFLAQLLQSEAEPVSNFLFTPGRRTIRS